MKSGHNSFKNFLEWHKEEGTERRVSGGDKRKRRNRELEESDEALKSKAEKSGISLGILKQVYNRGMAAYKTGHRPGTTAQQWALARVNSFITKGKGTWGGADKDLAAKARGGAKKELEKNYRKATPGQPKKKIEDVTVTEAKGPGKYIKSGDKQKYQWGDINQALMDSGVSPRVILNVSTALAKKEVG